MATPISGIPRITADSAYKQISKTATPPSSDPTGVINALGIKPVGASATQEVVGTFASALKKAINDIGESQTKADNLVQKLSTGETKDVHEVLTAVEEASLTMQLTLQLRNKAIEAYQEIMRMQV